MNLLQIVAQAGKGGNQEIKARINNAKFVALIEAKISLRNSKLKNQVEIPSGSIGLITKTREPGHPPRRHKQRVYPADKDYEGKLVDCDNIKISCNCEDWMFTWEFAQVAKGNADMIYCNGSPPVHRNPSQFPGLCKHLIVVLRYIVKKRI